MGVDFATATTDQHELELDELTSAKVTTSRPRRGTAASKRKYHDLALGEEDDGEEADEPVKKKGRKKTMVTKTATSTKAASASSGAAKSKSRSKSKQFVQTGEDDDQEEAIVKSTKRVTKKTSSTSKLNDHQHDEDEAAPVKPAKRAKKKSSTTVPGEEKRARRFRDKAPQSWQELYERATTQRMFVLDRTQTATVDIPAPQIEAGFDPVAVPPEQVPSATVTMAGTTGNVYS